MGERTEMFNYVGKRKHVSQMCDREINSLFERLKDVERKGQTWRMTGHTLKRMNEKDIQVNFEDVVSMIHNADIVEYKIDENRFSGKPEERVVLVSKFVVNKNYRLKVVYSLTERRIITTWVNHVKDTHKTLDWNLYTNNMPVFN